MKARILRSLLVPCFGAALCLPAHAQTGLGFPPVRIASGQTAHLSVRNTAIPDASGSSCKINFRFLDSNDKVLKENIIDIQPGKAGDLDLAFKEIAGAKSRARIRAVLPYGYHGGANPPPEILLPTHCGSLSTSLKIFDNRTRKTIVLLTNPAPLPEELPRPSNRPVSQPEPQPKPRQ